jgi:hypothetical protein
MFSATSWRRGKKERKDVLVLMRYADAYLKIDYLDNI